MASRPFLLGATAPQALDQPLTSCPARPMAGKWRGDATARTDTRSRGKLAWSSGRRLEAARAHRSGSVRERAPDVRGRPLMPHGMVRQGNHDLHERARGAFLSRSPDARAGCGGRGTADKRYHVSCAPTRTHQLLVAMAAVALLGGTLPGRGRALVSGAVTMAGRRRWTWPCCSWR